MTSNVDITGAPEAVRAETDRIAAVARLDLMGIEPLQSAFDDTALLASIICDAPMGLITVLDGTHQRIKAAHGVELPVVPQEQSFCVHTIRQQECFTVGDTLLDARFRDSVFVTGGPRIRFYAGMPLATTEGFAVGALCVLDTVPRLLSDRQREGLAVLSRRVCAYFDNRQQLMELSRHIAEKERLERELSNSNSKFEAIMDNSPLSCFMRDKDGRLVYYNRCFSELLEVSRSEWLGKNEFDVFPYELALRLRKIEEEVLHGESLKIGEEVIPGGGGKAKHHIRTYKFPFSNAMGERFTVGMSYDNSNEVRAKLALARAHAKLVKANKQLQALSITDALTGCKNRRYFDGSLEREFSLSRRHSLQFSILLIDIDNFKAVNDTQGHEQGDRVLQQVARLLLKSARGTDVVCRYGGEEFAIILPYTSGKEAFQLADRIRASIETGCEFCPVTISVGVETYSEAMPDPARLVRGADEALYRAKTTGKNRVMLASA